MAYRRSIPRLQAAVSAVMDLDKEQLHRLADELLVQAPNAIEQCIRFIEADTFGVWHGRARAMMARRLKHCQLSSQQQARLIRVISQRFISGRFSQQFKDQLRLALQLDQAQVLAMAHHCETHAKEHVRRYAAWILSHHAPPTEPRP